MNTQNYDSLASAYDHLQQAIDPVAWADYIELLQRKYGGRTKGDGLDGCPILVDLGCGTGSFCIEMEKRGYDPIGIDTSPGMLELARAKADSAGAKRSLFLQQDIARFELFGTVDLIVCLLDTLNHLLKRTDVARLFRLCANYLNLGGLFVFDVLTPDYFSRRLGDNVFYDDNPEQTMLWQNNFNPRSGISRSEILLFTRTKDNCYERSEAVIRERLYPRSTLKEYANTAGLSLLAVHGELTETAAKRYDNRHFYICRRER